MTIKQHLQAARDLISDPEHWCQGHSAEDEFGRVILTPGPAYRYCSLAALDQWDGPGTEYLYHMLDTSLINYNDTHTHAEVIALFDKAIASCA